jgi:general secretion pathway protein G
MAQNDIKELSRALVEYKWDTGSFPDESERLEALKSAPADRAGWRGPYLPGNIPEDPLGRAYIYRFDHGAADDAEIGTYGADGKPGGKDLDADIFAKVFP